MGHERPDSAHREGKPIKATRRPLRISAIVELVSLTVLLANLATVHGEARLNSSAQHAAEVLNSSV